MRNVYSSQLWRLPAQKPSQTPRPRTPTTALAVLAVVAALLANAGCGYQLAGRGGNLPEYMRTLAVPMFKISSFDFNLENVLTFAVIEEFERRGGMTIIDNPGEADAVIDGVIKKSEYRTFGDSTSGDLHVRVEFIVSVTLRDQVENQTYYKDENFTFVEDYFITGDITSVESNRIKAWEEASEDFAKRLVGSIVEGF